MLPPLQKRYDSCMTMGAAMRMVTKPGQERRPKTLAYNAIHCAYHTGYLTLEQAVLAMQATGDGPDEDDYPVFYNAWAARQKVTPRTEPTP